jgi:hypothetical protein
MDLPTTPSPEHPLHVSGNYQAHVPAALLVLEELVLCVSHKAPDSRQDCQHLAKLTAFDQLEGMKGAWARVQVSPIAWVVGIGQF